MQFLDSEKIIEAVLDGYHPKQVLEAVDSIEHAHSIFRQYGYVPDPRQEKKTPDQKWYIHENGHSAFLYFDPSTGFIWNHYMVNPRQEMLQGEIYTFKKGAGINTLEQFLNIIHVGA